MIEIYEDLKAADAIVLASPVYFYTWTSLMKRMIDRTFAVDFILKDKKFYLLSAGAAPEEQYIYRALCANRVYMKFMDSGKCNVVVAAGPYAFPVSVTEMII